MSDLTEYQPALISHDKDNNPVVIPAAELRLIARGLHSASDDQVQAMARFVLDWVDNG